MEVMQDVRWSGAPNKFEGARCGAFFGNGGTGLNLDLSLGSSFGLLGFSLFFPDLTSCSPGFRRCVGDGVVDSLCAGPVGIELRLGAGALIPDLVGREAAEGTGEPKVDFCSFRAPGAGMTFRDLALFLALSPGCSGSRAVFLDILNMNRKNYIDRFRFNYATTREFIN